MTPHELRVQRKKLGLSQFAVAKSARVSRYNIALFETGFRDLKKEELKRIKKALAKKEASHAANEEEQP